MLQGEVLPLLLAAEEEVQRNPALDLVSLVPYVAIFLLFILIVTRGNKKEKAAREAMLQGLKKNDKVLTIGGIIGTVANVSANDQEITLKVDDNTRIRVIRSAIQRVMTADESGEPASASK